MSSRNVMPHRLALRELAARFHTTVNGQHARDVRVTFAGERIDAASVEYCARPRMRLRRVLNGRRHVAWALLARDFHASQRAQQQRIDDLAASMGIARLAAEVPARAPPPATPRDDQA